VHVMPHFIFRTWVVIMVSVKHRHQLGCPSWQHRSCP
jgi:hypothetical protein